MQSIIIGQARASEANLNKIGQQHYLHTIWRQALEVTKLAYLLQVVEVH